MKNFDDLNSVWEDFRAEPYIYDDKYEITLMTRGENDLIIDIVNILDEENGEHFDLENIEIIPVEHNDFKIKYRNDNYETKYLFGEHPINGNENIMILELPNLGKRYFEKKSGDGFVYKQIIL